MGGSLDFVSLGSNMAYGVSLWRTSGLTKSEEIQVPFGILAFRDWASKVVGGGTIGA